MVALIIPISSNSYEESVGSHVPRVILFSTILTSIHVIPVVPDEVPIEPVDLLVAPEVGAVYVISPTRVLDLVDYLSSFDSDPSNDSLHVAPELPLVLPFLCTDDSKADNESKPAEQRRERHESLGCLFGRELKKFRTQFISKPKYSDKRTSRMTNERQILKNFNMTRKAVHLQAEETKLEYSRILDFICSIINFSLFLLVGNIVTNLREMPSWREIVSLTVLVKLASFTPRKLLTARKRVGPFSTRRIAWRHVSYHSSPDFTLDSSSSGSSSNSSSDISSGSSSDSLSNSSSAHSSGCDASGIYALESAPLSTLYPPMTSESSLDSSFKRSLDSSSPSVRPSRKRCKSPTTLVATNDIRENMEEFEAEASAGGTVEIAVDLLVTGGIYKSIRGDAPDLEGTLYDISHYMSEVPIDRITEFKTTQRQLEAIELVASG
nr:hypothetical protein [Tanacetum cinerariifolium]